MSNYELEVLARANVLEALDATAQRIGTQKSVSLEARTAFVEELAQWRGELNSERTDLAAVQEMLLLLTDDTVKLVDLILFSDEAAFQRRLSLTRSVARQHRVWAPSQVSRNRSFSRAVADLRMVEGASLLGDDWSGSPAAWRCSHTVSSDVPARTRALAEALGVAHAAKDRASADAHAKTPPTARSVASGPNAESPPVTRRSTDTPAEGRTDIDALKGSKRRRLKVLSPRDKLILRLYSKGLLPGQIANVVGVSEGTVRFSLQRALKAARLEAARQKARKRTLS